MQGERPVDGPARAGGDDAGRGEGRRSAAEDLARLVQDVATVLVAERLGAPGPLNDGQRAEVELGGEFRCRGAACFWHGNRRRPAGYLDRQVVPGPRGEADAPRFHHDPAGVRTEPERARDVIHGPTVRRADGYG